MLTCSQCRREIPIDDDDWIGDDDSAMCSRCCDALLVPVTHSPRGGPDGRKHNGKEGSKQWGYHGYGGTR